jgi:xanthine dehydrogenase accessory factor
MKEQKNIVDEFKKIDFSSRKAALATVVRVRGSSYRSPGARMLITDDGKWVGSISGGCLEGDALRKARQVMNEGVPLTITYDTREEGNQNLGIGLGCNGIIDVFIEPVDPADVNNPINVFESLISISSPVALATVFEGPRLKGRKILLSLKEDLRSNCEDLDLQDMIKTELRDLFQTQKSQAKSFSVGENKFEVFIELIQPITSIIIFGGGFDARPLSELAKTLGWNVTVTDECVAHIAPLFFPTADKLSLCQRQFVDRDFDINSFTACVLMSHNYEYDRDVLKKLLKSPAPYIGILGPRKRFDKMVEEFSQDGIQVTPSDLDRIHSPIGLDIGAETPDEIAVSIVAEIQGKFSNRSGGFLKYRTGPIHHRDGKNDQVFKSVYLNTNDSLHQKSS